MGARRGAGRQPPPSTAPPVEPPPSSGLAPRAPLSGGSCRDREGRGGAGWRGTQTTQQPGPARRPPTRPGWPLRELCRVGSGVGAVPRVATEWAMGSRMAGWGLWVAARSAAAHSRDLVCCVNRVEVIPS